MTDRTIVSRQSRRRRRGSPAPPRREIVRYLGVGPSTLDNCMVGGAREMDAVFGAHNWPGLAVGVIGVNPGAMAASSNEFHITLRGKGAHAAMPNLGVDPVPLACQLVLAFQTIVTRNLRPIDPAVISVTMIHAGEATNVVPDSVTLQGTVRPSKATVIVSARAPKR